MLDSYLFEGPSGLATVNTDMLSGAVNGWFDAGDYSAVTLQVTTTSGISAGAVLFEGTNDPTSTTASDGVTIPMVTASGVGSTQITASSLTLSASTTVIFEAKINTKYVRLRIATGITGGTAKCVAYFQRYVSHKSSVSQPVSHYAGPSTQSLTSAATTNATSVKTSAGTLSSVVLTNLSASAKYFKLYNKASAPTVGTDVPVATIVIPATSNATLGFGLLGMRFSTGIAYAITGAITDTDTTAVASGDVKVHLTYM